MFLQLLQPARPRSPPLVLFHKSSTRDSRLCCKASARLNVCAAARCGVILTNRITRTLPASISNYITDTGVEWGKIMAAGVLIALPPLIFTFIAAKQIITGLTAGTVKG